MFHSVLLSPRARASERASAPPSILFGPLFSARPSPLFFSLYYKGERERERGGGLGGTDAELELGLPLRLLVEQKSAGRGRGGRGCQGEIALVMNYMASGCVPLSDPGRACTTAAAARRRVYIICGEREREREFFLLFLFFFSLYL